MDPYSGQVLNTSMLPTRSDTWSSIVAPFAAIAAKVQGEERRHDAAQMLDSIREWSSKGERHEQQRHAEIQNDQCCKDSGGGKFKPGSDHNKVPCFERLMFHATIADSRQLGHTLKSA